MAHKPAPQTKTPMDRLARLVQGDVRGLDTDPIEPRCGLVDGGWLGSRQAAV